MRVRESMTRIICGDYTVRVWRNESILGIISTEAHELEMMKDKVLDLYAKWPGGETYGLDRSIAQVDPEIAAVEVVDRSGCGSIYYPDWK